tara:strand:- start:631 stop:1221 length:591 start_codon:yes stop_codon:yes gene_type:complete
MVEVLVLYYSRTGAVKELASYLARGINSIDGAEAKIRTVPEISPDTKKSKNEIPESGALFATLDDLKNCDGLMLGSPTRFGNMASPIKYFLETATPLWVEGSLEDKPAAVFTSSASMHGGNESTLLSMQLPLMHMGMILVGIPYSVSELSKTISGGTPYGSSHVRGKEEKGISEDEKKICIAHGKRLAELCLKIKK